MGTVATTHTSDLPPEVELHRLRRRVLQLATILAVVVVVVTLMPGLAAVRARLGEASPAWIVAAGVLEVLSCLSYVAVFRAAFCSRMKWGLSYLIGMSELAANSLLPAGGAGGLALGAWALARGGMPRERIARRTVAFFLVTSAANVGLLAIAGVALVLGIVDGPRSLVLAGVPAIAAVLAVVATLLVPRMVRRWATGAPPGAGRARRFIAGAARATAEGVEESVRLLRMSDFWLLAGAAGYLLFDIAVLWASFRAFGAAPPLAVFVIGYLVGQLGALIPIPGGIGGVDAGLIGALALYHVPLASATAAVIVYRAVLLLLPAAFGVPALVKLRRVLGAEYAPEFPCAPGAEDVPADRVRTPRRRLPATPSESR
jgi:uncharacterized membrane protein YbhN (UPF0104 family)